MDEQKRKDIHNAYLTGRNSIQDIARIFGVTVDDVLVVIGESHSSTIRFDGDLVDASEAGPNVQLNYGKEYKIPFTTN